MNAISTLLFAGSPPCGSGKEAFNLDPPPYKYSEDMLASKDIDGVMNATGDFQHAKLGIEVVEAGKDCYVVPEFFTHSGHDGMIVNYGGEGAGCTVLLERQRTLLGPGH